MACISPWLQEREPVVQEEPNSTRWPPPGHSQRRLEESHFSDLPELRGRTQISCHRPGCRSNASTWRDVQKPGPTLLRAYSHFAHTPDLGVTLDFSLFLTLHT